MILSHLLCRKRRQQEQQKKEKRVELFPVGEENPAVEVAGISCMIFVCTTAMTVFYDCNISIIHSSFILSETPEPSEDSLLSNISPSTVVLDGNHPPVKLVNLPKFWERLQKDSHHALTEEYKVFLHLC